MIKKIVKNLRPTDSDINLKYTCPNCYTDHWVSEKAARYSKFVIVCECDTILRLKTILKTKFVFKKRKTKASADIDKTKTQEVSHDLPVDCFDKCAKILKGYGFNHTECENLLKSAYNDTKSTDCATLIKYSLLNFGDKND